MVSQPGAFSWAGKTARSIGIRSSVRRCLSGQGEQAMPVKLDRKCEQQKRYGGILCRYAMPMGAQPKLKWQNKVTPKTAREM